MNIQKSESHLDIYNTIIFDIDTKFDEKNIGSKFLNKKRPVENLIFFHCTLNKTDFNKTIYHYCKFINCSLEGCNFKKANLWGTSFVNCDLKDVKFSNYFSLSKAECEGVEFRNCKNLTIKQLNKMSFANLTSAREFFNNQKLMYLIIMDKNTEPKNIDEDQYLNSEAEYKKWKNDDKN